MYEHPVKEYIRKNFKGKKSTDLITEGVYNRGSSIEGYICEQLGYEYDPSKLGRDFPEGDIKSIWVHKGIRKNYWLGNETFPLRISAIDTDFTQGISEYNFEDSILFDKILDCFILVWDDKTLLFEDIYIIKPEYKSLWIYLWMEAWLKYQASYNGKKQSYPIKHLGKAVYHIKDYPSYGNFQLSAFGFDYFFKRLGNIDLYTIPIKDLSLLEKSKTVKSDNRKRSIGPFFY